MMAHASASATMCSAPRRTSRICSSVTYRTGLGATGNVAADTITTIDPGLGSALIAVRNPFAVTDGADAETPTHIRRKAPQAFQAVQYRAVSRCGLRSGGGDADLRRKGRRPAFAGPAAG